MTAVAEPLLDAPVYSSRGLFGRKQSPVPTTTTALWVHQARLRLLLSLYVYITIIVHVQHGKLASKTQDGHGGWKQKQEQKEEGQ